MRTTFASTFSGSFEIVAKLGNEGCSILCSPSKSVSHPKQSKLEFRPGFREQTRCSYWDYYVDNKRLSDVFDIGDFIPPFGWLVPEIESAFVEMLLRKRESDFKLNRIPLFVCPECTHYGCGVFTCRVSRTGDTIEWRDFAMENDYEDELRQNDAMRFTWYAFSATEYFYAFDRFRVNYSSRRS